MGNIVLLDDLTINKIAAGEVIERPASVVKELMENSIDAGANNISVEIKNGGISYIRITDNGKGFAADDLEIAFERHATSKIRKADDLETVRTMGFRGEALASVAAISRVELITKTEEDEVGHKIVVEGGKIITKEDVGCPKGTTITIENLFYNTPVRYKFLKKDFTESGYIEDSVSRIALVNPDIAIKLINTGKTVIQTSGNGNLKDIIYGIYGKDIAENIINVDYSFEDMSVKGVIGRPGIARSNRSNQLFFVNKRYVKDKTLTSAAEQVYKGILSTGKYSFLVLNIEMDPKKLDVNVHPAKLEVRFQEENKIFKLVYHAIKEALIKENIIEQGNRISDGEDTVKNSYLNDILKIDGNKDDITKKDSHENRGIGSFLKSILSSTKNENSEDNVVEQVYKDKLKQEQNNLSASTTIKDNFILETEIKDESSNSDAVLSDLEHTSVNADTKQEGKNSQLEKNIVNEEIQKESSNVTQKEEEIDTNQKEENIKDDEEKGSSNLEKLVRELEANLEKLNIKQSSSINLDEYKINSKSENYENVEKTQNTKKENEDENNSKQTVVEKCDNKQNIDSEVEDSQIIQKELFMETIDNLSENNSMMKNEQRDKEETKNAEQQQSGKVNDFINNDEMIESTKIKNGDFDEKDEEKKTNEEISQAPKEEIENKTSDEDFEKMYAKMFGIDISNKNKVEEKNTNGYAVRQEDLKTVEKFSLFTNSSVYSKPAYKFIGIVFENSIIIEYEREMYIINQHAVNERILYEKIKKDYYSEGDKDSQLMLLPDIIELTDKEMGVAKDIMHLLKNAGFDLEEFGNNTIKLNGVPGICLDLDTRQLFLEILNAANTVARTSKQEIEEQLFETIAKKVAEKAKMALTMQEVDALMVKLLSLPQPFMSPQGTPTAIRMSKADIEKKFSRR